MLHGGAFEFHYHLNQKGCHPKAGKASRLVPEYLVESPEQNSSEHLKSKVVYE